MTTLLWAVMLLDAKFKIVRMGGWMAGWVDGWMGGWWAGWVRGGDD